MELVSYFGGGGEWEATAESVIDAAVWTRTKDDSRWFSRYSDLARRLMQVPIKTPKSALKSLAASIQWVKQPEREADQSRPPSSQIMCVAGTAYTSTSGDILPV